MYNTIKEKLKQFGAPSLKTVLMTGDYKRIRNWVIYEVTGWFLVGIMIGSMTTLYLVRQGVIPP